jgi:class 3 adenylate cyclase
MTGLPAGSVTLLFTDIEGSTRLLEELGDRYADELAGLARRPPRVAALATKASEPLAPGRRSSTSRR